MSYSNQEVAMGFLTIWYHVVSYALTYGMREPFNTASWAEGNGNFSPTENAHICCSHRILDISGKKSSKIHVCANDVGKPIQLRP